MSSESFDALERIIERTIKELKSTENNQPIVFLQDDLDATDKLFSEILEALNKLCSEPGMRPTQSDPEVVRKDIFDQIQEIQYNIEGVHSENIPVDIYYLLQDFVTDLDITEPIVINAGNTSDIFIEKLLDRFSVAGGVVPDMYSDIDEARHWLIEFQRSEINDPESYPLLIHELFHISGICDELASRLERLEPDIPENEREEVAVDLLSVNYLGPVYAVTTARMPEKIGDHQDWEHPSKDTRIRYMLEYIHYLEDKFESPPHAIYEEIIESTEDELRDRLEQEEVEYEVDDYDETQEAVMALHEKEEIPYFINEIEGMQRYLGMPDSDDAQLKEMINRLFLEVDENKEVALPIKPLLLLNFIPLIDESETSRLRDVYLSSFRKWYVRKMVGKETERGVVQIPDLKSEY